MYIVETFTEVCLVSLSHVIISSETCSIWNMLQGWKSFISFLLFLLFVLKRHVIGLRPHVMLLNIALQSPWHTQTHCSFCRGSQEGCRVHSNRVALSYLIVLRSHTHAYCAFETFPLKPWNTEHFAADLHVYPPAWWLFVRGSVYCIQR